MRWKTIVGLAAAFALGGLVLPQIAGRFHPWAPLPGMAGAGLGVTPGPIQPLAEAETYARAAQIAGPAVVNIDIRKQVRVNPGVFDDEWLQGPRFQVEPSQGSGVIITRNGDILTNEHVVGPAGEANKQILVTLQDGRKFPGTVIGSDHITDVALVHVTAKDLPAARIGTVRGLVPGQMAVAIGNPYGFRFTVTHGVVSALDRPIHASQEGRDYERLIQTDCAINPGNSGGALIDIRGDVIGINTIVLSQAQGIGFAIPIDTALRVADELKRFGKIKRPWLGVNVITNSDQLREAYNLANVQGAVAARIYPDGPAAEAGIQAGDVITKMNGTRVQSEDEFKAAEKALSIGQTVKVELMRRDRPGTGSIVVGEAP